MGRTVWAILALALALTPAFAQSPAADAERAARGLEAQYRAAIIRERRLADERELQLIADAETTMRAARRTLLSVSGDRATAQAALDAAREAYARQVEAIPLQEAATRIEVEAFRAELAGQLPQATPELIAAYQEFADGDRAAAWSMLEPLLRARANARVTAARSVAAGEVRQLAQLRGIMRENGEATTQDVLALWRQANELDPTHFMTLVHIARDLRELGEEDAALETLERAVRLGSTPQRDEILAAEVRRSRRNVMGEAAVDRSNDVAASRARLAAAPDSVPARVRLAGALREALPRTPAMLQEAEALARSAFAADPEAARITLAYILCDKAYAEAGVTALALVREAVDLARGATPMTVTTRTELAQILLQYGDTLFRQRNYEEAAVPYAEALALRTQIWRADATQVNLVLRSEALTKYGLNEEQRGNWSAVLTAYNEALEDFRPYESTATRFVQEQQVALHLAVARINLFRLGDQRAAERSIARARREVELALGFDQRDNHTDPVFNGHMASVELLSAELLARNYDNPGAIAGAQRALELAPNWPDALAKLAEWLTPQLAAETDEFRKILLANAIMGTVARLQQQSPDFAELYPAAGLAAAAASQEMAHNAARGQRYAEAQRRHADGVRYIERVFRVVRDMPVEQRGNLVAGRQYNQLQIGWLAVYDAQNADRALGMSALQQLITELEPAVSGGAQLEMSWEVLASIGAHLAIACMERDDHASRLSMAQTLARRAAIAEPLEAIARDSSYLTNSGTMSPEEFRRFCAI